MSWAEIDEEGGVVHFRSEAPTKDPDEGHRLSYKDHLLGSIAVGCGIVYRHGTAEGSALFQHLGDKNYGYSIRVIGLKVKDVEKVIRELRKALRVTDLTPSFFKLPALSGRLQRLKFLVKYVWFGVENAE